LTHICSILKFTSPFVNIVMLH